MTNTMTLTPIGHVVAEGESFSIHIEEAYRAGLEQMDQFSHFLVLWWADQHDTPESRAMLQVPLPYADNQEAGVFACRAEFRPNPVGVTVCQCLHLDRENGVVHVPYMDAFDGTPVLDLKPYFPVADRVREATVAPWAADWPQWYEEAYKLAEMFADCE